MTKRKPSYRVRADGSVYWPCGIVRVSHGLTRGVKLGYGVRHGLGYRWLPTRVQRWIVNTWNRIACSIWGHDDLGLIDPEGIRLGDFERVCLSCTRPLP